MSPETPQADIDVDSLLSEIEGGGEPAEIPMTQENPAASPAAAPAQPTQTPAQAQAQQEFYELKVKGQPIKATREQLIQWAQQGYDYPQRMQEIRQQQELYKQWESKYKPIDEYIQQDPQWWEHVQSSYQQRLSSLQQQQAQNPVIDPVLAQKIQTLESKINEVDQFKQTIEQKEQAQRIEQEDQQLTQQIQSIREQYPDLDWAGVGAQGKSLEMQVFEHGIKHGIKDFGIAFRDFNHEALVKKAEERGKEQIAKERQRHTKLGLLGKSPTPSQGLKPAVDVKQKSYEDLVQEAKEEFGIA